MTRAVSGNYFPANVKPLAGAYRFRHTTFDTSLSHMIRQRRVAGKYIGKDIFPVDTVKCAPCIRYTFALSCKPKIADRHCGGRSIALVQKAQRNSLIV